MLGPIDQRVLRIKDRAEAPNWNNTVFRLVDTHEHVNDMKRKLPQLG